MQRTWLNLPIIAIIWAVSLLLGLALWVPVVGTLGLIAYVEAQRRMP